MHILINVYGGNLVLHEEEKCSKTQYVTRRSSTETIAPMDITVPFQGHSHLPVIGVLIPCKRPCGLQTKANNFKWIVGRAVTFLR